MCANMHGFNFEEGVTQEVEFSPIYSEALEIAAYQVVVEFKRGISTRYHIVLLVQILDTVLYFPPGSN